MGRQVTRWKSRRLLVCAILGHGYALADISWDRRLEYDCSVRRNCESQLSIDLELARPLTLYECLYDCSWTFRKICFV